MLKFKKKTNNNILKFWNNLSASEVDEILEIRKLNIMKKTFLTKMADLFNIATIDLKKALEQGADPNSKNLPDDKLRPHHFYDGASLLHEAVSRGKADRVLLLFEYGADPNIGNKHGETPIHEAIFDGNYEIVKILLENGADPNIEYNNLTPLYNAVKYSYEDRRNPYDMAELLLRYKADPNIENPRGETPLDLVVKRKDQDMIDLLVKHGAIEPSEDDQLVINSINEGDLAKALELLVQGYPLKTHVYDTELMLYAIKKKKETFVKSLLDRGFNVNRSHDVYGRPILLIATEENYYYTVNLLLGHGTNPNVSFTYDSGRETPIQVALNNMNVSISLALLGKGAVLDPDNTPSFIHTVFSQAALVGNVGVVKSLLDQNISPHSGGYHDPPLFAATKTGKTDIVKILLDYGVDPNKAYQSNYPLNLASIHGWLDIVILLLEGGGDVDVLDSQGNTSLYNALYWDRLDMAKVLLEYGASKNLGPKEYELLKSKIKNNDLDTIQFLLDNVLDVNAKYVGGDTLLHTAVKNRKLNAVTLLLQEGADVNATNDRGETPLIISLNIKTDDITEELLDAEADPNIGINGETPLFLAVKAGNIDMVEELLSVGADPTAITPDGKSLTQLSRDLGYNDIYNLLIYRKQRCLIQ